MTDDNCDSGNVSVTINIIINEDEEEIFFLIDQYMIYNNELDTSIELIKYYCNSSDEIDTSISQIVITSCSSEEQLAILENYPELLLLSISDKEGDICNNDMYNI